MASFWRVSGEFRLRRSWALAYTDPGPLFALGGHGAAAARVETAFGRVPRRADRHGPEMTETRAFARATVDEARALLGIAANVPA